MSATLENLGTGTPVPESILDLSIPSSPASAVFQPEDYVVKLSRVAYQAKEKIEFVVKNARPTTRYRIDIKNSKSSELNVKVDEKYINGEYVFSINPEVGMRPGSYTVKIIDADTNETVSTQDFTWGVLAINTNKSMYLPEELASIAIGVLDEGGRMVCDATVNLEIESPLGTISTLSTQNGGIIVNRECLMHEVTVRPDYEASFLTGAVGRYNMKLTANTLNGTYTVNDRFEVRDTVPFDVERITATRIYPPKTYPVEMKIKANQPFRGKIIESVPHDFQISKGPDSTLSYSQESGISESYNIQSETNIPDLRLPFDDKYPVTLGFGQQIDRHGMRDKYKQSGIDGHDGIDFALPAATPVLAVDSGEVILAQENWVYGHTVVIEHSWGRSYYGHLSKIGVKAGETISPGSVLGLSGNTGLLTTGPHLHFSLKPKVYDINNLYYGKIDPAPFFGLVIEDEVLSTAEYPLAAKAIVWNVDLQAGDEITIGYHYKAPYRSPYFYSIGPLQFVTSEIPEIDQAKFDVSKNPFVLGTATPSAEISVTKPSTQTSNQKEAVIFSELRQWQIASDADSTIVLDANADGTCGSGCWTVPSDWTDVNTIYAIGGGGAGDNLSTGGGGGGGGAYARILNADLTASTNVNFSVGSGGTDSVNGGNTWFCNNTTGCANYTDSNVIVSANGGTTSTSAAGGAGGDLTGIGPNGEFAGGAGGTGSATGDDSTGGGGGAGSPNGTGGTGGNGDGSIGGDEAQGGGGGSGCDSIGASNDGTIGGANGGPGGNSCFANGGTTANGANGNPGTDGSGGGGGDTATNGGVGGDGISTSDPSIAGGGGGGGDPQTGTGANGGLYGGGGGGGATIGTGAGGVIIIIYTQLVTGPTNEQIMRHGSWFDNGIEQSFSF
ncbi:MAG: peptidoglycan DD-metalloendopeptidase family protein [Candidatus Saccharibacteria bacterium]|nr:peptidoglycan DD-metalloendopeptidase family protein [Candidatus Saccharibacteria bacterium]